MPVTIKNGNPAAILFEDYVGKGQRRICYPGIDTCISITAVTGIALVGTHITAYSPLPIVDQLLDEMSRGGAAHRRDFYVIGAVSRFKNYRNDAFDTRKKIRDRIRSRISSQAIVQFCDLGTIPLPPQQVRPHQFHVFAERNNAGLDFFWLPSQGNFVPGGVNDYPNFAGRVPIDPQHFVIR